jgi:hypothetical protein
MRSLVETLKSDWRKRFGNAPPALYYYKNQALGGSVERQNYQATENQRWVLNVTWKGSVAALVVYSLLPWFVRLPGIPDGQSYTRFRIILWVIALVQVGVIFWWERALRKEKISTALHGTAIDPVAYYKGRKIAAISLAQSVAAYGFVLALVGHYFWDQYFLTLISALLLIRHYPSGTLH